VIRKFQKAKPNAAHELCFRNKSFVFLAVEITGNTAWLLLNGGHTRYSQLVAAMRNLCRRDHQDLDEGKP
jgi:hypothetical protein